MVVSSVKSYQMQVLELLFETTKRHNIATSDNLDSVHKSKKNMIIDYLYIIPFEIFEYFYSYKFLTNIRFLKNHL